MILDFISYLKNNFKPSNIHDVDLIFILTSFPCFSSERALSGPTHRGKVKTFCRQQGHGFIIPEEVPHDPLFVHISELVY